MDIFNFITATVAFLRKNEYVNQKAADDFGTPTTGKTVMRAVLGADGEVPESFEACEDDRTFAYNAIDFARAITDSDAERNSFLRNLRKAANESSVTIGNANMLACLPRTFYRHMEAQEQRASHAGSGFVGVADSETRITLAATVLDVRTMRNHKYPDNETLLIRFTDTQGNILVWWTFSKKGRALCDGDSVIMETRVKSHDEYKGVQQTRLYRPNVERA